MRLEPGLAAALLIAGAACAQTTPATPPPATPPSAPTPHAPAAPSTAVPGQPAPSAPSPQAAGQAVPAAAAAPKPVTAEVAAQALAQVAPRLAAGDCAGVLAILDPLLPGLAPGDARQTVQRVRLSCLIPAGRPIAEVSATYDEIAAAAPRDPGVRALGIALAMDERDYGTAAKRLASAAEDEPVVLGRVQSVLVRALRQQLAGDPAQKPLFDRLDLALAQAGWQSPEYPELADSIRANAVQVLVRRGAAADARVLLAQVEAPELLADMAMERVYQPVWPEIEARMGAHGGAAVDSFAASRLEAYARQPNDDQALSGAVRAFALLNRPDDVVALAGQVTIADGMSEDLVNAVRFQAEALVASGHTDQALDRLSKFESVDLAKTPAAVSALVLYAEMLGEAGQSDRALGVASGTLGRGKAVLSPWGTGWLMRTEACALATLARPEPAREAGDALVAQAESNPAAAVEGLLCLNRRDEAAKIAIATLARPDGADQLADQFQPVGAFWLDHPSKLRALWQPLLARPDVKLAFGKVARILPAKLWPDPKPRAIPRDPSAPSDRHLA